MMQPDSRPIAFYVTDGDGKRWPVYERSPLWDKFRKAGPMASTVNVGFATYTKVSDDA